MKSYLSGLRPTFKWIVAASLFCVSAALFFWKPTATTVPAKVELLPFDDSPPAWNGSKLFLTISAADPKSDRISFRSSVSLVQPTIRHEQPVNDFQVDLHSGMFVLRQTDLFVADVMPLSLTRTYKGWDYDNREREFGSGANHPYDICPTGTRFPYTYMDLILEDFEKIHFPRVSKGTGYADAVFRHSETSSEFYGALISWNGSGWTLAFRDGHGFRFPEAYHGKTFAQGAPVEIHDGQGHSIQLQRDKAGRLQRLVAPSGHAMTFKYDDADRIAEAEDDAGNSRMYTYDSSGHLESVTDGSHLIYRFKYAPLLHSKGYDPYLMTAVLDGKGRALLRNIYEDTDGGRISEQRLSDGSGYRYRYIFVGNEIVETIVRGPSGERRFHFLHGMFTKEE